MARLGIVMASMGGTPFSELTALAKEAESRGVEAVFSPEFMNDALATCQAIAADTSVDITTGLPAFISDDLSAARATAKRNLALAGSMPYYNQLFRNCGFQKEAEILSRGDPQAAVEGVSDQMIDELNLIGPPSRCKEQLAAFREAGIQLPIVVPNPVGEQTYTQAVRTTIETFAG